MAVIGIRLRGLEGGATKRRTNHHLRGVSTMRVSNRVLFVALCLPALAAQGQTAQPGELVPPFGDGDGIKRIDFNDLTGGTVDRAKSIVLVRGIAGAVDKILIAGLAGGRRVGIVRLNANGQGDQTFGIDGRALSTRTNVRDVAGMVRMPNGDIVVGYSDDYIGAAADSKDFFIEVFDANGQPKNIGGPEVANQRFVDLSTNGCDLTFLENAAHSLVVTTEGNLLATGELTYRFGSTTSPHGVAFAEFDGVSYAPTRPAWGILPECRSTGGGFAFEHRLPDEPGNSLQRYARDAVSLGGGSVHVAGSYDFLSPSEVTAGQSNVRLGGGALNLSSALPPGFWRNGNSIFNRIRLDRNDSSQLLLFGERESGKFGSGQLLRPLIGKSTGGTMTPFFFRSAGTASSTTITLQDGDRIPSSEQFWVIGSANLCTVANNCTREFNSLVVGLSTGATLFDTYLPDNRFAGTGWIRLNIPNYNGFPTLRSSASRAAFADAFLATQATDMYVFGDFAFDDAGTDHDWYVAKIRIANGLSFIDVDPVFRDGFE